ncbi:hypothetical protein DRY37_18500 [Salmonella enterica subsp. salamae]|nr:hypothetical protein [Salmonella enterica]ECC9555677.1 hypothetical protein [Salmonella enterica subsp. salamae]ECI4985277.1 hypothetical protein [Salmonella enterica subsp. salamae]ECJ4492350.1 hypothetical protein [Salmonella enterica subsp. salamae]
MARPAGFEPATHGLEISGTTKSNNKLSHYYGSHSPHPRKTCKALQADAKLCVSRFCPKPLSNQ